jgi:hypothetical protein
MLYNDPAICDECSLPHRYHVIQQKSTKYLDLQAQYSPSLQMRKTAIEIQLHLPYSTDGKNGVGLKTSIVLVLCFYVTTGVTVHTKAVCKMVLHEFQSDILQVLKIRHI